MPSFYRYTYALHGEITLVVGYLRPLTDEEKHSIDVYAGIHDESFVDEFPSMEEGVRGKFPSHLILRGPGLMPEIRCLSDDVFDALVGE